MEYRSTLCVHWGFILVLGGLLSLQNNISNIIKLYALQPISGTCSVLYLAGYL